MKNNPAVGGKVRSYNLGLSFLSAEPAAVCRKSFCWKIKKRNYFSLLSELLSSGTTSRTNINLKPGPGGAGRPGGGGVGVSGVSLAGQTPNWTED